MVRLYSTEKETNMRRNRLSILKSAVELAILYFPLLFLSDLIEEVCPFANIYVQSTASALLCFCVLFSNSSKTALKKWSCSIPFTLIFYFVLAATNFDVRLINRLLPGYGHLSAGAGFAFIIEFGLFTIAQVIANLAGNRLQQSAKCWWTSKNVFYHTDCNSSNSMYNYRFCCIIS